MTTVEMCYRLLNSKNEYGDPMFAIPFKAMRYQDTGNGGYVSLEIAIYEGVDNYKLFLTIYCGALKFQWQRGKYETMESVLRDIRTALQEINFSLNVCFDIDEWNPQ